MAKRRNLHEDSQDPDRPVPPAPPPRRRADIPPGTIPPVPAPPEEAVPPGAGPGGAAIPKGFFGQRALFLLLRLGVSPQPVRLTFIAAAGTEDADIEALLREPGFRAVRRAPGVYDVDLPSEKLEGFVMAHHERFRRVEAPGWLFGAAETAPGPNDRVETTIEVDEPLTTESLRELERLGFHLVAEGPGEIRGVVLGKHIADLVAAPFLGPIEVRKVHPPKK